MKVIEVLYLSLNKYEIHCKHDFYGNGWRHAKSHELSARGLGSLLFVFSANDYYFNKQEIDFSSKVINELKFSNCVLPSPCLLLNKINSYTQLNY